MTCIRSKRKSDSDEDFYSIVNGEVDATHQPGIVQVQIIFDVLYFECPII